jgi:hypothetical protein
MLQVSGLDRALGLHWQKLIRRNLHTQHEQRVIVAETPETVIFLNDSTGVSITNRSVRLTPGLLSAQRIRMLATPDANYMTISMQLGCTPVNLLDKLSGKDTISDIAQFE